MFMYHLGYCKPFYKQMCLFPHIGFYDLCAVLKVLEHVILVKQTCPGGFMNRNNELENKKLSRRKKDMSFILAPAALV